VRQRIASPSRPVFTGQRRVNGCFRKTKSSVAAVLRRRNGSVTTDHISVILHNADPPHFHFSGLVFESFFSCSIWRDKTGTVELEVRYPSVMENIPVNAPNVTSGILVLTARSVVKVIWASDAPIEMVAKHCSGAQPDYMVGPHHGAPIDRSNNAAGSWLRDIGAGTTLISVGSFNSYPHPQKSYIRKSLHAGSRIVCTQLTKLCDKNPCRDVIKSPRTLYVAETKYWKCLPWPGSGDAFSQRRYYWR
jgi:hypothetical protein